MEEDKYIFMFLVRLSIRIYIFIKSGGICKEVAILCHQASSVAQNVALRVS